MKAKHTRAFYKALEEGRIAEMLRSRVSMRSIASEYGVSLNHVWLHCRHLKEARSKHSVANRASVRGAEITYELPHIANTKRLALYSAWV